MNTLKTELLRLLRGPATDTEVEKLGGQFATSSMQVLNLSGQGIGAAGGSVLGAVLRGWKGKVLHLADNDLGEAGVVALAPHLPSTLTKLFLRNNDIGEDGKRALKERLPRCYVSV